MKRPEELKKAILDLTKEYYSEMLRKKDASHFDGTIRYAGRIFDEKELVSLVDASLEFWLTAGRYVKDFEEKLAGFLGVKYCLSCNSGSSANLLAFMAMTSPLLGDRRIVPGDEVITVAAGFPTTVAPMIQYGAIPVFVDITMPQYNLDCRMLENALSGRTKAVMAAHTLGNPMDLTLIRDFCNQHQLWLIEDNCDSLGSRYFHEGEWKYTGTIGDIGTSSFYPPHHITTGEGGAVYTNNPLLSKIVMSLRDWGRDCSCPSGTDNKCGKRFDMQFGELPSGYDHKYVYSHFGYNLKMTEMQAAIGVAQLEKLPAFIEKRKENWRYLRRRLEPLSDLLLLPEPCPGSEPSWFGFLLTVKEHAGFNRDGMVRHLESKGIQTRMLFAGNLIKHPCFDLMREKTTGYRVIGNLNCTDIVMRDTFWIGVYPGLGLEQLDHMTECIREYAEQKHDGK